MTLQSIVIPSAYLLDLVLGDPRWLPHPVRWMGRYIAAFEGVVRPYLYTPFLERFGGFLLLLTLTLMAFSIPLIFIRALPSGPISLTITILLAYTTIAVRSLHREAMGVVEALRSSESKARERLSMIVGRDTASLDRDGILRATIETVAENTSDGIVAPLFYLLLGGVPLAMVYKAVNTLDSMVGYRDDRYRHFGWAPARADDLLNYIPARITASLMLLSSLLLGLDWRNGLRVLRRDGRNHPSPNAGLPEAVAAGVLRVRLGGGAYYRGIYHRRPSIGEGIEPLGEGKVVDAVKVMHLTAFLMVLIAVVIEVEL